jgi:CTP synthase (UTP-ammonia lyase)
VKSLSIALVGDFQPDVPAHQGIPLALALAGKAIGVRIEHRWVGTETIDDAARVLAGMHGAWCVPASPYRSMDGALRAIRHAREAKVPFLGTCGGFQHAVIEFARNVMHVADADHAETNAASPNVVITALACKLYGDDGHIQLRDGSQVAAMYGARDTTEQYFCGYGIAPAFQSALNAAGFRIAGTDDDGAPRVLELDHHPFYVATLFQPERAALRGVTPPIVTGFVKAALGPG